MVLPSATSESDATVPAPGAADDAAPAPFGVDPTMWMLDRRITFLNHGSFGALSVPVAAAQTRWRGRIEAEPIEMLDRRGRELLCAAREAVAALVGADASDLGFVTNATEGVNAFLASVRLGPGDVIATTDHGYNAVRQAMRHRAAGAGATVREIPIPLPVAGPDAVVHAVAAALDDRTRLLVIDHVTSPTALVFPVERIAQLCAARSIDLLVDGAHTPGMLPLDLRRLSELGVVAYAANLHKWVGAPKGSAFLWVRNDRQPDVHPLVVSHFLGGGFEAEFAWQGTRDITPWLCAADAIAFLHELGLERLMVHNATMARWVQRLLSAAWNVDPISPADGSMLGSMATVPLPDELQPSRRLEPEIAMLPARDARRTPHAEAFMRVLYRRFAIEAPLVDFGGRWHLRPCCQVYNTPDEYRRLAEAVLTLAAEVRAGIDAIQACPPPAGVPCP